MLGWPVTFLVIAVIAAALGFGGIAGTSAGIAKILFFVFLVLFVVTLIGRAMTAGRQCRRLRRSDRRGLDGPPAQLHSATRRSALARLRCKDVEKAPRITGAFS